MTNVEHADLTSEHLHNDLSGLTTGDPHTQYQKESEKDQNSGYAGLNSSGRVPIARLASGTPDGTKFIRDDGALAVPAGGGSDDQTAAEVPFTPAGTVAATNVQAAIEEVASEAGGGGGWTAVDASETVKGIAELATQAETNTGTDDTRIVTPLKLKTNVDLHINDTTDAHDASAISVADAATQYTATNVEDALAEVLDGLQAHEADSSDAHDASAISFSPVGTIAATDVQAAIAEVASEASGGSGYRTLVTLSTDRTNTTSTLADVTGLSFSVSSGTTYRFEALMIVTSSAIGTAGPGISVNGPASPTLFAATVQIGSSSVNNGYANINAYDQSNGAGTLSRTPCICTVKGIVTPSTSGTLIMRFNMSGSSGTITVKAGSTLEWY